MATLYTQWGEETVKLTWQKSRQLPEQVGITSVHGFCFYHGQLLLVDLEHRGWDFPGGHIEEGEGPEDCLAREAMEEGYVRGSSRLLGYITVDHRENKLWKVGGKYPQVGYQVFYRMDISQLEPYLSEHEAKARMFIPPDLIGDYYHEEWRGFYQEILTAACEMEELSHEKILNEKQYTVFERTEKKIVVEAYNPLWKSEFQKLSAIYTGKLGDLIIAIEHVGSTAIENLCAKPILDIDIVIKDKSILPNIIEKLEAIGYVYEGDLGIKGREAFSLQNPALLPSGEAEKLMEHHLYVCTEDSRELKRHISFRDLLRNNSEAARAYGKLKQGLAETAESRIAYTEGKGVFILSRLANE